MYSRIFTVLTVSILMFALNVSGALGWFFRTFDGITANGVPNPAQFLFGLGSDLTGGGLSFGYGFGYGYGDFNAWYGTIAPWASSSGWGGGGGWSSSSSSSSGGSSTPVSSSSSSSSSSGAPVINAPQAPVSSVFTGRTYPNETRIATCGVSIVSFNDIAGNTFEQYIKDLEAISGLNGNGNGSNFAIFTEESKSFQPNRSATRSEYIKMILRALCIDYSSMNSTLDEFADGAVDPWQAKVFNKAVDLGWVSTNNTFARVNDTISRAEALKIVMQAGIADSLSVPASSSFADVAVGSWQSRYTEAALNFGIVAWNTNYRPGDAVTRGESTKLIMRTLYGQ